MDKGIEMTDQQAKEGARNKNFKECYNKIQKTVVMSELKEQSVKQWQRECVETTKAFFPKIEDRIKQIKHNLQLHNYSD